MKKRVIALHSLIEDSNNKDYLISSKLIISVHIFHTLVIASPCDSLLATNWVKLCRYRLTNVDIAHYITNITYISTCLENE